MNWRIYFSRKSCSKITTVFENGVWINKCSDFLCGIDHVLRQKQKWKIYITESTFAQRKRLIFSFTKWLQISDNCLQQNWIRFYHLLKVDLDSYFIVVSAKHKKDQLHFLNTWCGFNICYFFFSIRILFAHTCENIAWHISVKIFRCGNFSCFEIFRLIA